MIEIKDILSRFDKIIEKEETKLDLIREAILNTTNIKIKREEIEIKKDILYLKIKPIYKNEIFLKKDKIIHCLNEQIKNKKINNIF